MQIPCPRGCKRKGRPTPISTLKGWKRHMTYAHGEWTDAEIAAAMQIAGAEPEEQGKAPGGNGFDSFASSLPDNEAGIGEDRIPGEIPDNEAANLPPVSNIKTDAASKAINAKFAKIKKSLAESLPEAVDAVLADNGPEWALSKRERDMLTDAMESVFDMLDIQFQIEQFNVQLKSRMWVLLYPLAVLLSIFAIKTAKHGKKKPDAQNSEPEPKAA